VGYVRPEHSNANAFVGQEPNQSEDDAHVYASHARAVASLIERTLREDAGDGDNKGPSWAARAHRTRDLFLHPAMGTQLRCTCDKREFALTLLGGGSVLLGEITEAGVSRAVSPTRLGVVYTDPEGSWAITALGEEIGVAFASPAEAAAYLAIRTTSTGPALLRAS